VGLLGLARKASTAWCARIVSIVRGTSSAKSRPASGTDTGSRPSTRAVCAYITNVGSGTTITGAFDARGLATAVSSTPIDSSEPTPTTSRLGLVSSQRPRACLSARTSRSG
jgi:hypothetical protein